MADRHRLGPKAQRILDYVRDHPGAKTSEVRDALGLHGSSYTSTMFNMKAAGWIRPVGATKMGQPTPWVLGPRAKPASEASPPAVAEPTAVARRVNGTRKAGTLAHPVPGLGDGVQVHLLALNEDGTISVGFRDGDASWLARVEGFTKRPSE